jgi:hypothetical protein
MDYDVWIAQDNIRRYREILGSERNVVARAKLEGLIMLEKISSPTCAKALRKCGIA